jgi:hypothetical protein
VNLRDKRTAPLPTPLTVIQGGRAQLEVEIVAALVDPCRFSLAREMLARLDRCGEISLLSNATPPAVQAGATSAESSRSDAKGNLVECATNSLMTVGPTG